MAEDSRTLTMHCVDGVCHCDWRLTIYDCAEANAMWYIYIVNIAFSAVVIAIGTTIAGYPKHEPHSTLIKREENANE